MVLDRCATVVRVRPNSGDFFLPLSVHPRQCPLALAPEGGSVEVTRPCGRQKVGVGVDTGRSVSDLICPTFRVTAGTSGAVRASVTAVGISDGTSVFAEWSDSVAHEGRAL